MPHCRYDTIIPWIEELAAANPGVVTLTELGKSHEGRYSNSTHLGKGLKKLQESETTFHLRVAIH